MLYKRERETTKNLQKTLEMWVLTDFLKLNREEESSEGRGQQPALFKQLNAKIKTKVEITLTFFV